MNEIAPADAAPAEPPAEALGAAPQAALAAAELQPQDDPLARLQAWQATHAVAPVRLVLLQALARRASAQEGALRQVLLVRLQWWMARSAGAQAPALPPRPHPNATASGNAARGALGRLVDGLQIPEQAPMGSLERMAEAAAAEMVQPAKAGRGGRSTRAGQGASAPVAVPRAIEPGASLTPGAPPALRGLHRYRGTWERLSAEERLRQVFEQVPPQAGPLNSHHLVHRALVLMRDTSPEYLQRFVVYVDTLLALDQMQRPVVPATTRSEARRRAAR